VRYFFRRRVPELSRMLLVESGSRPITEQLIPRIRSHFGDVRLDVVTCFADSPRTLESQAKVYNVNDYRGRKGRLSLVRMLRAGGYPAVVIVCSNEPILAKWKWALVMALPAKVLVANENCDYFWLDYGHWNIIRKFVQHRAGLADAGIVRAAARAIAFPFGFLYLLVYATFVHSRRFLRRGIR